MAVDRDFLKSVLERLTSEYESADERRRRALQDMAKAQSAIKAIYALSTDEPIQFKGTLADACRTVLREASGPMSPVEVRNAIVALGYNLTQHKNPLASIHSVLKRLAESGDLKHQTTTITKDGSKVEKPAYVWARPDVAPLNIPDFSGWNFDGLSAVLKSLSESNLEQWQEVGKQLADFQPITPEFAEIARSLSESLQPITPRRRRLQDKKED